MGRCWVDLTVVIGAIALSASASAMPASTLLGMQAAVVWAQSAEEEPEEERRVRRRLVDAAGLEEGFRPDLTATPVVSIDRLLDDAAAALRAGRLFEPEGDNALSYYLQVLDREPQNQRAREGIDQVVERMMERANQALRENRGNEAQRLLNVAERFRPDAPSVQELRRTLEAGRELAALLAQAADARRAGQLVAPAGSSAADLYRQVLQRDPQNAQAREGLAAIEQALLEQARQAIAGGRFEEAERIIGDAGRVNPGSSAVLEAATRLQQAKQARASELVGQAEQALSQQRFEEAERLIAEAERLTPDIEGLEEFRERITSVKVYASMRPGQVFSDNLQGGGRGPEMVVIPLGSFRMGSPEREPNRRANEGPQFEVRFARAFALSRSEITVGQFRAFVQATGYQTDAEKLGDSSVYSEETGRIDKQRRISWENDYAGGRAGDDLPVVHVSWNDANAYAQWLARSTGLRYRLPSEAEFEYALRAGTTSVYPWGDGNPDRVLENVTGDGDRSPTRRSWTVALPNYNDGFWGPAPVRSFPPNPFGLHDMNGNVSEWVQDCWHDNYVRAPADGRPWVNEGCARRVIRGGSWASTPDQLRSAFRIGANADFRSARVGFRVAREL